MCQTRRCNCSNGTRNLFDRGAKKNRHFLFFKDRDLKSTVFRIRGLVPANNYIQFPAQLANQNLALTGRLFYILFRPIYDKFFSIHIDIVTHEQHVVRISISNLYRDFKATQTCIQFPYTSINPDIHWTVLCLDLESILLTYMTNQHYHMIKSFQLCGNMMVKNCFSSQFFYEPSFTNHKAKQSGLKCSNTRLLPRELCYPVGKDESWHNKYDFRMIPNQSSSTDFDTIDNVHSQTPRDLNQTDEQISQSLTDLTLNTQRSDQLIDRFSSLPTMHESSLTSVSSRTNTNDGIHLFVDPQLIHDDLTLTTDRSQQSHLPDPILRLRTVIGLTNGTNLLWTQDGNYVLYSSNAIVVQMQIDTQQQWFFIGHTDKVSAIAFNGNSSLLATIQAGPNGKIELY
jgi:hypothetical protein